MTQERKGGPFRAFHSTSYSYEQLELSPAGTAGKGWERYGSDFSLPSGKRTGMYTQSPLCHSSKTAPRGC